MRYNIRDIEVWISKEGTRGKFYINGRKFSQRIKNREKEEYTQTLLNNARLSIYKEKTGQNPHDLSPEKFREFLAEYKPIEL